MAKNCNVALIGQGFMGRTHSNAYLKVGKFFTDLPMQPTMHTSFGMSHEELAERFDRSPSWVSRRLALACELPAEHGIPLSRFSMADLKREAIQRGLVASIGETTIWRWLSEDAIRPWRHRSWLFPRDPLTC